MDIAVGLDRRKVSNLLVGGAQLLLLVVKSKGLGQLQKICSASKPDAKEVVFAPRRASGDKILDITG